MTIICRNSFETGVDPVQFAADEAKGMVGNAKENFKKCFGEKRRWDRETRSLSNPGFRMLTKIKLDIHKEIAALRHRQEILESIGCVVNGGF